MWSLWMVSHCIIVMPLAAVTTRHEGDRFEEDARLVFSTQTNLKIASSCHLTGERSTGRISSSSIIDISHLLSKRVYLFVIESAHHSLSSVINTQGYFLEPLSFLFITSNREPHRLYSQTPEMTLSAARSPMRENISISMLSH